MRYDVVFNGEFSPEYDIDEAKQKMAQMFKLTPAAADKLFSGQSVTLKKNVDATLAEKYRKAAAGCGVIFELAPVEESPDVPPSQAAAARDATMVICPNCGYSQSRSTTCLKCGEFLIKPEETASRPAPIARVTVPVSSAEDASGSSRNLWKKARIGLLLLVLFIVGMNTVMTGRWTTDWDETLWVGIYPINGDDQAHVADYISSLDEETFRPIVEFFNEEAEAHGLPLAEPFTIRLAPVVSELPPSPPTGRNPLAVIWWSLKMRFWVYRHDTFTAGPSPDIKIFTIYHDARHPNPLENSLGLRKGLFGVVHAYADYRLEPKNQVVIAHEILHTVGARDKYDMATQQPIFPDGYADPDRKPLYPQPFAEIMGSRIPLSKDQSQMPPTLQYTVIGKQTAREIKWIE
jgi:ribosomal protein L32